MGQTESVENRLIPEPEDIAVFRKLEACPDHVVIPEVPEKRKPTDVGLLITFGVCILLLFPFLIYTFVHADINRFVHGYDRCGNICGQKNDKVDGISCSGQDRTNEPFLEYRKITSLYDDDVYYVHFKCVSECGPNFLEVFHKCYPKDGTKTRDLTRFLNDIADDLNKSAGYIVLLCFIGFGFCIGMLLLFRYFAVAVVWITSIASLVGIIGLSVFFWYLKINNYYNSTFFAVFCTIMSVLAVILLICMFKRIRLVVRLFKETVNVVLGMPLILLLPLLTLVASYILLAILTYFWILIHTAGFLDPVISNLYYYSPSGTILFTLFYHIVICVWMAQFIMGCQHMVISGSVSAYYFARDKSTLVSPIYNSFYNLVRYHLGTVAFGSLIITVVIILKALIRALASNKYAKIFVDCCLGYIEGFLKFLSKNAYIQTAMHGQPFYKSGQRAVDLLLANALSTIAINSVGEFVLGMAQVLVVLCTIVVGILINDENIKHFWAAIVVSAVLTGVITNCFFAAFETAIDTLFICFCEDNCLNDGTERPYYMTVNLMQYIEDTKKALKEENE